jgi:hypothetical protein
MVELSLLHVKNVVASDLMRKSKKVGLVAAQIPARG